MLSRIGTIFFTKLLELLELLAKILELLELLTKLPELLELTAELLKLLEEKIQGVLLAKCCSSLEGYWNSLPHFLHIRSLLDRLLAIFFL